MSWFTKAGGLDWVPREHFKMLTVVMAVFFLSVGIEMILFILVRPLSQLSDHDLLLNALALVLFGVLFWLDAHIGNLSGKVVSTIFRRLGYVPEVEDASY